MIDVLPVYIGFDVRERDAWYVCERSLRRHSNIPLYTRSLNLVRLEQIGLYWRKHVMEGRQKIDAIDGLPFSTDFSFSRFLVPALQNYTGWALFCDSDILFLGDIGEVAALADDRYAVMVCKQNHQPLSNVKMDEQAQTVYRRKNWSSFMLFNCGHPSNKALTVDAVNTQPGRWLHQFAWLKDEEIGELPPVWNFIAGTTQGEPKAVHYTNGGPWFGAAFDDCAYAKEWTREYRLWRHDCDRDKPYNLATPRELVA